MRYLAIGASDAVGEGATDPATKSWPALLFARMPPGSTYHNVGVGGSTVAQAILQQLPAASGVDADVMTVWLAVNDLNDGVEVEPYRGDLAYLLDALLRAHPGRVFVGNVPDLTRVPYYATSAPEGLGARVAAYNAAIAEVVGARSPRAALVDLFTGSEVIGELAIVAQDGLHPNDLGYELIAERFAEAMRAAGLPLR